MKRALILDTNIYLNFLKYNEKDEHNFYKLLKMDYFEFDLFIPDIVLEEWNDNKYKVIEEKKKVLENIRKSVDINKDMNSIMEGITKEIDESFKLLNRVINAEYLTRRMGYLSELIDRANIIESNNFQVYQSVIEKAINQSPPFFNKNKKSEVKDALIWHSILVHFKKDKNYDEILFVTENKNDFADKSNANQLHPNLKKESLKNLKFTNNIRDVIRSFDVNDKYKIIETVIEKQDQLKHVYEDKYYEDCECCGEELHVNLNIEKIGRNIHYKCPHCGHSEDTGLDYHQTIIESDY